MITRYRSIGLVTVALLVVGLAAFLIARVSSSETVIPASSPPATATTPAVDAPAPAATTPLPPAVPGPTASRTASSSEPHDDNAQDPDVDNERVWGPVVTNFGRNFTDTTGGNGPWRKRLIGDPVRPFVTTTVAKQLATVDVRTVPTGNFESYEVVNSSTLEVAVKVDYNEGWSTVLYLNTDGVIWQIYAYDRYEE